MAKNKKCLEEQGNGMGFAVDGEEFCNLKTKVLGWSNWQGEEGS